MTKMKIVKISIILFFLVMLILYLFFFKKINTNDLNSIKDYTENEIIENEYTDFESLGNKIKEDKTENDIKSNQTEENKESEKENMVENKNINDQNRPRSIKIKVPFTSQAPTGNWDQLHEEACEETSLLMIKYHKDGRELVLSSEAEKDIQQISQYIKNNLSNKEDLNINELKELSEKYFKISNTKIINNPSIEDLEKELSLGNLIVAPMAGRELNNPFFKNPGPLYHMLVISGYDGDKKEFTTQDPGTKRGKDFIYPYETILKAIHDFPDKKENILMGEKRILVFLK